MAKNNVRVKIPLSKRRQLLKSAEVQEDLKRRADKIRDSAGGTGKGYVSAVDVKAKRVRASVYTLEDSAKRDNARNNSLVRALDAGRD